MTKTLIAVMCLMAGSAIAQNAQPQRVAPAAAKDHVGQTATVCGKVVDATISKYGIGGRGKPVTFDLDEPQPNQVFYFVAFGTQAGGPDEAVSAYQGKHVCVTGKISTAASGPYILAADRSQVKTDTTAK